MLPYHAISDADWERIKDLLPGRPGQPGWVARDYRRFLDAVSWLSFVWHPLWCYCGNPDCQECPGVVHTT